MVEHLLPGVRVLVDEVVDDEEVDDAGFLVEEFHHFTACWYWALPGHAALEFAALRFTADSSRKPPPLAGDPKRFYRYVVS